MRLLPWLAGAQALGIVAADRAGLRADFCIVLAASGVALALVLPRRLRGALALTVAFAAGGAALARQLERADAGPGAGALEVTIEGRVREVRRSSGSWRVELERVAGLDARAPERLLLYGQATPEGSAAFEASLPGQFVRARVRLRTSQPLRNPGAPDRGLARRRAGVGAVGGLLHPSLHAQLPERAGPAALGTLHRLRQRVGARLQAAGPGGPLLRALALGDASGLSSAARDAFARLGIAHLLAVSGLHLALLATLVYGALWAGLRRVTWLGARGDPRRACLAAALVASAAYALLAGWGVPVRRALVLLGALAAGVAAGRSRPRLEPLALASIVVLAGEPQALFAPGAQLSFAATAGLLWAARSSGPEATREGRLASLLRTSATAFAATAPLAALQLGSRAPFALAANLVAVPWTALVLLPASLAAALAADLAGGAGAGSGPAGVAAAALVLAERAAAATLAAAEAVAPRVPGAVGAPAPAVAWLLAATALALGALAVRPTLLRVAGALAVAVLLQRAPAAPLRPEPPRIVFLDVGQGDATLVQGRRGTLLVDAGVKLPGGLDVGRSAVVPALRGLGVERLDLVVASHADLDHRGGLPAVLEAFAVGELWLPKGAARDPAFGPLVAAARRRGATLRERGAGGAPIRLGDLRVTPLWPPAEALALSRNDRSLVLRVELAGRRLLLAGDLEAAGEAALLASGADLRADVLKLPHHGSRSSSTAAFLEAVDGVLAVASAPCQGRFGMPHAQVLERAARARLSVWWTGRDGAVLVGAAEGGALHAAGHGAPLRCPR